MTSEHVKNKLRSGTRGVHVTAGGCVLQGSADSEDDGADNSEQVGAPLPKEVHVTWPNCYFLGVDVQRASGPTTRSDGTMHDG